MSDATLLDSLKDRFGADILSSETARDELTIFINRDRALEFFRTLRDDPNLQFDFLTDVTALDWLERKPRFEVVYQLNSLARGHRLRVKIGVDGGDAWVHSVAGLWRSADWLEREVFDMFGVDFKGHPDLRRILMYDSFEGHPLRKDYNFQKRQPIVPEIDPVVNPLRPSR